MTRTYRQAAQITISAEADSKDEAIKIIDGIKKQIRENLPTGAKFDGSLSVVMPA